MSDFCCSNCFNPKRDRFHAFIRKHGFISDETCPYCKSAGGIKIDTAKLGTFIKEGIDRAYDDTREENETSLSVFEILNDRVILFEWENHREHDLTEKLFEGICDVDKKTYRLKLESEGDDEEQYRIWRNFEHDCKYFNRFFDLTPRGTGKANRRTDMLQKLYESCLKNLKEEIEPGTELFRARVIDSKLKRGRDYNLDEVSIGPADKNNSQSGRMNPEGISYFYVAEDEATALKEGRLRANERVLIGRFKTLKKLTVIDWTKANIYEKAVDIFSPKYSPQMAVYQDFLRRFAIEVGKPNETAKPIEYVATQLVAEYVRGYGFDGIKYDSAVGNGFDVVFFYGPEMMPESGDYNVLPEYTDIAQLTDVREFKIKIEYFLEP
ncbi:MAG: RES family NAD+ phosphorylase [Clostridiales bacterium]|nr:RES family NAD+ phosphorylase [Clostridiales bacterium]